MCNNDNINYGLPLALIMEEILEWEKPKADNGKEQEEQENKEQGAAW